MSWFKRWQGFALLAVASSAWIVAGCAPAGPTVAPVKGTLTIGGKPADGVQISFSPIDASLPTASGPVKNGSFELFTGSQGKPGATPGKYKVVLAQTAPSGEDAAKAYTGAGGPPPAPKASFPEKYKSAKTSDKDVEVKSGPNDIKIDIPAE